MTEPIPHILTIKQVCELTQLSDSTVRRAIRTGRLQASRPGGNFLRITKEAVQQWMDSTSTKTPSAVG